jgi:hypothetical protein
VRDRRLDGVGMRHDDDEVTGVIDDHRVDGGDHPGLHRRE